MTKLLALFLPLACSMAYSANPIGDALTNKLAKKPRSIIVENLEKRNEGLKKQASNLWRDGKLHSAQVATMAEISLDYLIKRLKRHDCSNQKALELFFSSTKTTEQASEGQSHDFIEFAAQVDQSCRF